MAAQNYSIIFSLKITKSTFHADVCCRENLCPHSRCWMERL